MELDGPLFWVFFIVGLALSVFLIVFMVTVLRAAQEALIFFRNANAESRGTSPTPTVNPADTVWDDIR